MMRGPFYKPETGPTKHYRERWASSFNPSTCSWSSWRLPVSAAVRTLTKKRHKKRSRFYATETIARDLAELEEVGNDHDETTCILCYHDMYGRYPENPEDFKYGKTWYKITETP